MKHFQRSLILGFTERPGDGIVIFTVRDQLKNGPKSKNIMMSNTTHNKRTTQKSRLLSLLATGKNVTVNEARKRCRIANPSAVVSLLRDEGVTIFTNVKKTATGVTYAYRMSDSSR